MNEFKLIERYFNWTNHHTISLGVGDDCAIIDTTPNTQTVTSVDTLIEGVHFPKNTNAADIAYKALAVNLSDLAAMGATPKYFTLALTLPKLDEVWLTEFSNSLKQMSNEHHLDLIGGDTTKGALSVTINIVGEVATGKALLRSGAQVDDLIYVSNNVGDAAYAWQQIEQGDKPSDFCLERFNRPTPRVGLAQALVGVANACIDISDGLAQDLSHILSRSKVGANISLDVIPLSDEVADYINTTQDWCVALAGGDDYELCFTVSKENIDTIKLIEKELGIALAKIGVVTEGQGLKINGLDKTCKSYQHF
ncbi:MAG: thiamine-phosphate kinase [Gammaproteobacteria bacterium]|nr:MAG: thiamine-phosphate kinase [Gammaproteobacteria bacterium]